MNLSTPIEDLKVRFAGGTPVVENNNTIRVTVEVTRPSFTCVAELLAQGGRGAVISSSDCKYCPNVTNNCIVCV